MVLDHELPLPREGADLPLGGRRLQGSYHRTVRGYNGRNPKTGEVIPVKPKRGILFRTGKELRERVNAGAAAGASAKDKAGGS